MSDIQTQLRRRWLYLPFAIAGVIVLAYYLLWRAGAGQMEKGVIAWVEDQREAGMEVSYASLRRDGFPFFLRVHIEQPYIASPDGWRWRAERLSLDALPYELNKVIFSPGGEQFVSAPDYGEWRVIADDLRASIAADKARGWAFSANVGDAHAQRDQDGAEAKITSLIFDLAPDAKDPTTLALSLAGSGATLSAPDANIALDRLQTVMLLTHSHMLDGPSPADQWRGAGGSLIVNGLIAEINAAALSVSGQLGLDYDDYPAGQLRAELSNPAGLAETLSKTGALSQRETDAAIAGLSLMALAGGGKITAPIDLKDGKAQINGIKIADLPQIQ